MVKGGLSAGVTRVAAPSTASLKKAGGPLPRFARED
ncbi:hypothetical protein ACVWYO_000542 [Sphingomonas sp. UYP23]